MSQLRITQFILMTCIISIGMGQFIVFAVLAPLIRSVGLQEIHGGLILSFSSVIYAVSVLDEEYAVNYGFPQVGRTIYGGFEYRR